jgi:CheY-like chemotaxis protein
MLGLLLTRNGAEVVTAASAEDALAKLGRSSFDLLVSDIGMPGVNGYELIRRVREMPAARGGQTPAVALTAYARAEDRVRALRGGFQTHVAKPVEPAELIAVAASLTRRNKKE